MWHGYAFASTVYPVLIAAAIFTVERLFGSRLWSTYSVLKLKPYQIKYSVLSIYLCCLLGGFSHIVFDMFTYESMSYVIYPLFYGNPFYFGQPSGITELTLVSLALYSVFCWSKTQKPD